jgi:DNA-binding transcriptional regulator YiaG
MTSRAASEKPIPFGTKKKKTRTPLQEAIIALRESRNFTQKDLANYMNHDLSTVGRWEAMRPPRGLALVELSKVAYDFGREDLREIFDRELEKQTALVQGSPVPPHIPLEFAVGYLFRFGRVAAPAGTPAVRRAYRKALRALVEAHRIVVGEVEKGRLGKKALQNLEDFQRTQIEIEEMEQDEERGNARKTAK